ncbi:MAG: glycosyltransferase family 2 protein [Betaproteobacteria bacterium]|nr:MAG: glycosyltransferase family 2 protein [Betaproteobacteria bacterium]
MLISVIIFCDPAHDNSGLELVEAYANQTLSHAQFEVIIADNCHRAEFENAVRHFNEARPSLNVRYVPLQVEGRAACLNAGILLAKAQVIAFLADDALPSPTALASHLNFHQENPHPLAAAVGPTLFRSPQRADGLRRWLEDSGTLFGVGMRTTYSMWPQSFFFTGNVSVKIKVFEQVGTFNTAFPWITWDDFEFGTRLIQSGGYSQLVTGALAWHEHYVTLAERTGAMRKGGHAAVIHDRIGPIVRPWQPMLDRAHRRRHELLQADDDRLPLWQRVPIFERTFDRAFLEGYEAELKGDRSDLEGLVAST